MKSAPTLSVVVRQAGRLVLVGLLPLTAAQATDLAQSPLYLLNAGAPNIFFLNDDSGSMKEEKFDGVADGDVNFHEKNPLYYNPKTKYLPWPGLDSSGNPRYVNMTLTAADNYNDSTMTKSVVNLITAGWSYKYRDNSGAIQTQNVSALTDAADKTNFANWYTYHRSRAKAAKYAIGSAVNNSTGKRIGYGTINDVARTASRVIPITDNNNSTVLNALYSTSSSRGTPLQISLDWAGKYFEGIATSNSATLASPILIETKGGACQLNNTILMTDGYYNNDGDDLNPLPTVGNADKDKSATQIDGFDGPPYSDPHSNTLADIAMHYYERDLSPLPNMAKGSDKATHQRMHTYTVAFGLTGNITNPNDLNFNTLTSYNWGVDPTGSNQLAKIDDLFHASVNSRARYFSAGNPDQLTTALNDIVSGVGSAGNSANVVATSAFSLKENNLVITTNFNPADWSGEIKALKVKANGTLDETTPAWSSNTTLLFNSNRNIITHNGTKGVPFTWSNLTATQRSSLAASGDISGYDQYRVAYLRGQDKINTDGTPISLNIFRKRSSVMGDVVNSSPVYVGAPSLFYPDAAPFGEKGNRYTKFWFDNKSREAMVYVGANDGMLHGFKVSDGTEQFAYVPNITFPKLKEITDPAFRTAHKYFVDQTPTISDVYTDGAWKSVLVSGLGAGGRGLFALDITDPSKLTEANADKVALWEFSNADDADLGYTLSKPVIALSESGKWVAITGNGYGAESGDAALFILDINASGVWSDTTNYKKIVTGDQTSNGLFSPAAVDTDGNGKVDRVYAGDLLGNMWVFNLNDNSKRLLFTAKDKAGKAQPITSKPTVIRHPSETTKDGNKPNMLVLFGTGSYLTQSDLANSDDQSFYAVWDDGTPNLTRSNLANPTLNTGTDTTLSIAARTTSTVDVAYKTAGTGKQYGWYIELDSKGDEPSERVVTSANVYQGIVFFTTYAPSNNPCDAGGESWFMTMKAENGAPPDKPIISINKNRTIEDADVVTIAGMTKVAPSGLKIEGGAFGVRMTNDSFIIASPNSRENLFHNLGTLVEPAGRISWRELRRE